MLAGPQAGQFAMDVFAGPDRPAGAVDPDDNRFDVLVAGRRLNLPEDVAIEPFDERPVGPDDSNLVGGAPGAVEVCLVHLGLVFAGGRPEEVSQDEVEQDRED